MNQGALSNLFALFREHGAVRLYVKILAENDNSKNQIYLASSFEPLSIFPSGEPVLRASEHDRQVLHSELQLEWLTEYGTRCPAPYTKLILYPQYPEVRLSGFLRGCVDAPRDLLGVKARIAGRALFLGVRRDGVLLGFVAPPEAAIAREVEERYPRLKSGVLAEIELGDRDSRAELLRHLRQISQGGWHDSVRLGADGTLHPCMSRNCGGYTLEAHLGIYPNSKSEPDYLGWEVKQFGVNDLSHPRAKSPITLMTPEPTGGLYAAEGVLEFVRRYGYADTAGRPDRRNFGGVYRVGSEVVRTRVTMQLLGFDQDKKKIADVEGGIALLDRYGEVLAMWPYANLIGHWNRKHAQAAYVPSSRRSDPQQFMFGSTVYLGTGTDFGLFLRAIFEGAVVYDPGIKVEAASTSTPRQKRRSQFRIPFAKLPQLYRAFESVSLE